MQLELIGQIIQYFYTHDACFYFLESCQKLYVNVPIIPGIMPISDFERLMRFLKFVE
ncbi:hypothetical protein B1F79_04090 [Coxiella-like endosymbiont of Rhipicephalus sanguineus]|uniref:methylenetetrahydrofolate reductase n=1 Tax=Coxiella-like endosymbiont of Rhipicephalus sanguineus TaxID=1955402 RepID=UPI003557290B|nr:hypothetical protein [Coxiella-like endosymbiont of Rhipicephalus sanguineus]